MLRESINLVRAAETMRSGVCHSLFDQTTNRSHRRAMTPGCIR
jgi:hypothetical protein